MIEGYLEANNSPRSYSKTYLDTDGEEHRVGKQYRGSLFEGGYKLLSRKFSFNSELNSKEKLLEEDNDDIHSLDEN